MTLTLHHGDCLDILPTLPSASVDLIFADPPFNLGKKYGDGGDARPNTKLRWRSPRALGQMLDYWDDIPFVYAGSIKHPEAIIEPGTNRKVHPAQMPLGLPKRAIEFSTAPGDVALDPFNGSGTSGEASLRTGRSYIGIEREAEYCRLSEARWARALHQIQASNHPAAQLQRTGA